MAIDHGTLVKIGSERSGTESETQSGEASEHEQIARPERVRASGEGETRKRKPYTKKDKAGNGLDIKALGRQITGFHAVIATLAKAPLLAIEDQEGEALAKAVVEVAAHYDVALAPKTAALVQLVLVAAGVYLPKVAVLAMVAKANAAKRKEAQALQRAADNAARPGASASPGGINYGSVSIASTGVEA